MTVPPPVNTTYGSLTNVQLYSQNASYYYSNPIPLIISEYTAQRVNILIDQPVRFTIQFSNRSGSTFNIANFGVVAGTLRKCSGFSRISNLNSAGSSPVLISMANYRKLVIPISQISGYSIGINETATAPNSTNSEDFMVNINVPKGKLFISIVPGSSFQKIGYLVDELASVIANNKISIQNLALDTQTTSDAVTYITLMFYVVASVGMILCFFVLWISFTANMRDNSWEFGVLRALGLPVETVIRLYIYEAICIITASIITGTITGLLTSVTITLQFNLFGELPFVLQIPTVMYCILVLSSLGVAVAGSYYPAMEYGRKRIANVLKGK